MVFQNYNLIDYLTPVENLRLVNPKADLKILEDLGLTREEAKRNIMHLSGGQRQRVAVGRALVSPGSVILADEPTTALDVTVQAEILDLLRLARDEFDASVLIITHNMGVIADIADEVVVMYRGHVVEQGGVEQIFYSPQDDYTKTLLGAAPSLLHPRLGQ